MELLCLDIINSNRFGGYLAKPGKDMLGNDDWLRTLIDKWNLDAEHPIKDNDLKTLQELRDTMQQSVKSLNYNAQLCAKEFAKVNSILEKIPCRIQLVVDDDRKFMIKQTPLCGGWTHVIWSVAYSFARLMSEYDQTRIKICENKDCGWIFYDESKSRTRRWCDHKICGNIMKVRRFRNRQKQIE